MVRTDGGVNRQEKKLKLKKQKQREGDKEEKEEEEVMEGGKKALCQKHI